MALESKAANGRLGGAGSALLGLKRTRWVVALGTLALITAACGAAAPTKTPPSKATVPNVGINSFSLNFGAMSQFKSLVGVGKGPVGVILPDTVSSTRYTEFDAPYLKEAMQQAGYPSSDIIITNAQGSDATELSMATSDITKGAKVLVMDPLDGTVASEIQALASSHGVALVSYDRATFAGTNTYYVSFNNFKVGQLIGQGLESCISAWHVSSPQVWEVDGGENSDPNAISFAQGYNSVIWGTKTTPLTPPKTNSKGYNLVGDQVTLNWDVPTAGTNFAQALTAHPSINAVVVANDEMNASVVQDLKSKGVSPKTIPTTGQDATLTGMENILTGYQCGTVYKPIFLEAQDAIALATILRAGKTPPSGLVNSTTTDPANSSITEPASLLVPEWVTPSNMESTVIKDKFIPVAALCTAVGQSVCSQAGIH
ncbi:MAG TPA: substrate-binding domain-containing protein [Candidatus Acidoferrales bacterium]|nr:substrate-binding domain-containing protein [Candidatus Acidoferrales bacterium]HVC38804.1 substrate-binding domain-containing protein [Candidatus Dormibacteraeota bacterium]